MQDFTNSLGGALHDTWVTIVNYLPTILAAFGVLLVGWLVATVIAWAVRKLLKKTSIDNRIVGWLHQDGSTAGPEVEKTVSRVVFWLIMIFVLIAFFQTLRLTAVATPLNGFLAQILEYIPRIFGAALLLALAWLLATGLRILVVKVLERFRLDERFGEQVEAPVTDPEGAPVTAESVAARQPAKRTSLSTMLGEVVYWGVFLLFLPAIIGALGLEGLLGPIQSLVDEALAFLPNLLAAALSFLLGWFLARIVQRIVTHLAAALGADTLAEKVGFAKATEGRSLSRLIGLLVYVLILVPVTITALDALGIESITRPASAMLNKFLLALPAIFGAALVIFVTYIVGRLVAGLVSRLLAGVGFDRLMTRLGWNWEPRGETYAPSNLAGKLVLVVVLLFAAIEAARLLGFDALAVMVASFLALLGNVILGLILFALGLYLANLAANTLRSRGGSQGETLASVARIAILVLAGAMALRQMNVAEDIINLAFGLTLGALAVAFAIAFGVGGRELAKEQLEKWREEGVPLPDSGGPGSVGGTTGGGGVIIPPSTTPPTSTTPPPGGPITR